MGQETCFPTAPCAWGGYNFGSNNMTFQLPAILRLSTLGKLTSSYARPSLNTFFLRRKCESAAAAFRITVKTCYCSQTSFMSLLVTNSTKKTAMSCESNTIHTSVVEWAVIGEDAYCILPYSCFVIFMCKQVEKCTQNHLNDALVFK